MNHTGIEWAAYTWNPITGCSPISAGCEHCYARRMAYRLRGRCGYPGDDPFKPTFHPSRLDEPRKLKKPSLIFVCSMGDLFHCEVRYEWHLEIFQAMATAGHHHYLILTKRPMLARVFFQTCEDWHPAEWPNVWLGVSVENRKAADLRIPRLLKLPVAGRFVSIEPMLGAVNIRPWLLPRCQACGDWFLRGRESHAYYDADGQPSPCGPVTPGLNWVICGGETGPDARPMNPDWARDLRDQCHAAGVPFFFKRMGAGRETPDDLKVREVPEQLTHYVGAEGVK